MGEVCPRAEENVVTDIAKYCQCMVIAKKQPTELVLFLFKFSVKNALPYCLSLTTPSQMPLACGKNKKDRVLFIMALRG